MTAIRLTAADLPGHEVFMDDDRYAIIDPQNPLTPIE